MTRPRAGLEGTPWTFREDPVTSVNQRIAFPSHGNLSLSRSLEERKGVYLSVLLVFIHTIQP
jgi:hypothetical protein